MKIVEGVMGYYHYHLSESGKNGSKAICGYYQNMMQTSIPLPAWGTKSHLKEKWCEQCWEIYNNKKN